MLNHNSYPLSSRLSALLANADKNLKDYLPTMEIKQNTFRQMAENRTAAIKGKNPTTQRYQTVEFKQQWT